MTKKDYILLATALYQQRERIYNHDSMIISGGITAELNQWQSDCIAIADALASDRHRFDRARFLAACKGE